jgi:hypothetical protein
MVASLLVLVSAAVGLAGGENADTRASILLSRGWFPAGRAHCTGWKSGVYYELANDDTSAELYSLGDDSSLASRLPLPEEPYQCREIPGPSFVEEIQ